MQKLESKQQPVVNVPNVVYWLITAAIISVTTPTLGYLWRRKENHRWTTGYGIIYIVGFFWVLMGYWDLNTWCGLFFATGVAGIVKVGLENIVDSTKANEIREAINGRASR